MTFLTHKFTSKDWFSNPIMIFSLSLWYTYPSHTVVRESPGFTIGWRNTTKGCNSASYCTNWFWKIQLKNSSQVGMIKVFIAQTYYIRLTRFINIMYKTFNLIKFRIGSSGWSNEPCVAMSRLNDLILIRLSKI